MMECKRYIFEAIVKEGCKAHAHYFVGILVNDCIYCSADGCTLEVLYLLNSMADSSGMQVINH